MIDFQMCFQCLLIRNKISTLCIPYTPRSFDTCSGVKLNILACPKRRCCPQLADNLWELTQEERNAASVMEMLSLVHYVSQAFTAMALVSHMSSYSCHTFKSLHKKTKNMPLNIWKGLQYFLLDL